MRNAGQTFLGDKQFGVRNGRAGFAQESAAPSPPGICLTREAAMLQGIPVSRAGTADQGQLYCAFELRFWIVSSRPICPASCPLIFR